MHATQVPESRKKKTQNVRHRRLQIDEQAKAAVVGFQFRYNKKI